jgi:hypothetical protein
MLGQFLVALKMLKLEERAARRRGPLQDLRVVRAFAEVPDQLVERGLSGFGCPARACGERRRFRT